MRFLLPLGMAVAAGLALAACGGARIVSQKPLQVRSLTDPSGFKTVYPDWRAIARAPLGSQQNPVRADLIQGERAYLARLRCPSGAAPSFERQGALDTSPYGTVLNAYQLTCPEGRTSTILMDLAHANYVEHRAVRGFSIVN